MKAVIMAGGEGSRLKPLTCDIPKPMVPVMNIPIMEHIIELLKSHGIKDIAVTLAYLPQKIIDYFGNGSGFDVNIHYFIEDYPLGTAGSVKNAEEFFNDTFVVISGDSLTDLNLTEAINYHKKNSSWATLVLTKVDVPLEYGVVITNKDGRVNGFLEKPSWGEVISDTVNTGTYILEPKVLTYIEKNSICDFSNDLFPILLKEDKPLYGYVSNDYWCDIGDLQAYSEAHYDILTEKIKINIRGSRLKENIWIGSGTTISPTAEINGPCFIGNNCIIGDNSKIDSLSILGNNNVVEADVSIKRSILWNNNYIEFGTEIRGAIICNKSTLKHHVSIFENSIVGDKSVINERAIINPNVKIWPHKTIAPLATVDRNVIWASKHIKTIFGENGISGIINVDINPEFATRLGASYGSVLKKGSKVVVSSTTSNSVRMFKHAFISGILSVGIEVFNLSSLLTPISRHAINFLSVEGGIHIKLSNDDPNKLHVDFMDSKGATISRVMERKIENAFFREDFQRCSGDEVSRLNNITDFKNYYIRAILNEIDVKKVRDSTPKVCIFSPSDFVISTVVPMLTDVGCKVANFYAADLNNINFIKETIHANDADFGAFIDSNGDELILVNKAGNIIKDNLFLALTSLILFKKNKGATVVVPVTATSIIDLLAKQFEGKVIRTKTSTQAIMEQMLNHNLLQTKENMNQFLLNFDALASLVKIVEHFSLEKTTLCETLNQIPSFYLSEKKIFCPWELKGTVMRTLINEKSHNKIELLDGVKFNLEDGWVLVIPDADSPLCRVYSEGNSSEIAEKNCEFYVRKIESILNTPPGLDKF